MKIFGLKLNQITLLAAGLCILISLPWVSGWGIWLWLTGQALVVLGVIFVLRNL